MTRTQPFLLFAALAAGIGFTAAGRSKPPAWLINETPSLPPGLYQRSPRPPTVGAIVAVIPPATAKSYLASLGAPADARLLKRVAAGPGETVCRDPHRLTWPGGQGLVLPRDRRGRALPNWSGCRRLEAGEVLVMGDSAASFDSRYFGPVSRAAIEGVYRETWRW